MVAQTSTAITNIAFIVVLLLALLAMLLMLGVLGQQLSLWFRATRAGVPLSMFDLIGMRLRGVRPGKVVPGLIRAHAAGFQISPDELVTHQLGGGRADRVVAAMVAAQRTDTPMSLEQACTLDLAGRDPLEAVRSGRHRHELGELGLGADAQQPRSAVEEVSAESSDGVPMRLGVSLGLRMPINALDRQAELLGLGQTVRQALTEAMGRTTSRSMLENPRALAEAAMGRLPAEGPAQWITEMEVQPQPLER